MVLNFTAPRYTLLFLYSEIYIVDVINCEWSRSINFALHMFCINMYFSNKWYQSGLQFQICITCFVNFGIRDNNFLLLENYTFNFLHGCWNYCLMKIDINVMMLFKFNIKYVKLNFRVIVLIEFSFDINLCLSCSYDGCLFMKNRWKLLQKNSGKLRVSQDSIDRKLLLIDWVK